jgi:hypothetical protein
MNVNSFLRINIQIGKSFKRGIGISGKYINGGAAGVSHAEVKPCFASEYQLREKRCTKATMLKQP